MATYIDLSRYLNAELKFMKIALHDDANLDIEMIGSGRSLQSSFPNKLSFKFSHLKISREGTPKLCSQLVAKNVGNTVFEVHNEG